MAGMVKRVLFSALLAIAAAAQPVKVYSEFQRVDPFGAVLAVDRAERPREILSPALARGAWASFFVVLAPPEGEAFHLFLGQNPDNAAKVNAYRVLYTRSGETWIPDGLEPLELSPAGLVPPLTRQAPGQTVIPLWLDVWFAPDAPVRRTRLEVQLSVGEHWVIYPLELRVQTAVAAEPAGALEPLGRIDAPASDSALAVLRGYACGGGAAGEKAAPSIRAMIRRNARQDLGLARSLESRTGSKAALLADLLDSAGLGAAAEFCRAPNPPRDRGAEWYLKVRDFLYRAASAPADVPKPTITVRPPR